MMNSVNISTNKTSYYSFVLSKKKKIIKKMYVYFERDFLVPLENYISKKTRNTDKGHYSYTFSRKFFFVFHLCNFCFHLALLSRRAGYKLNKNLNE